jgi:competence protein ComEC
MRLVNSIADSAKIRVRGNVNSQPYHKVSKQYMKIGRILILTETFPRFNYGDLVEVTGKLQKRLTDSGKPEMWLMYPDIVIVERLNNSNSGVFRGIISKLYKFRRCIEFNFADLLPEPHVSLLSGVLLGVKGRLPDDFYQALRSTGTMHVVVASGYNVTVIAGVLVEVLVLFVSRRWVIPLAIVGIFGYTVMAGADPPIVRAAIMGSLLVAAQFFGKAYHGFWALILTGVLMAVVWPLIVFDVGFQLSLAATFGILALTPVILRGVRRMIGFLGKGVAEELAVTLGAQLMVLPVILVHFGKASWISPLVNLIVAFLVPVIMGVGGLLTLISFIWIDAARVFALLAWVPLTFFISVIRWFDRLGFGAFSFSFESWWWVVAYYVALGFFIWRFSKRRRVGVLKSWFRGSL